MDDNEDISPGTMIAESSKRTDEFADMLAKIEYATTETKKLWFEIYQNAVEHRSHAMLLFSDIYRHVANDPNGHALHGKLVTMYLEKMEKANDQLLKLAELIETASGGGGGADIDAESLYDEISKK